MTSASEPAREPRRHRVLIVEDEALLALLLEDMLTEIGCDLAGAASTIEEGLKLAASVEADAAILDVNVGGTAVYPVAETLAARGIPVIFSTGYGAASLPARWREQQIVDKPFLTDDLRAALTAALGSG